MKKVILVLYLFVNFYQVESQTGVSEIFKVIEFPDSIAVDQLCEENPPYLQKLLEDHEIDYVINMPKNDDLPSLELSWYSKVANQRITSVWYSYRGFSHMTTSNGSILSRKATPQVLLDEADEIKDIHYKDRFRTFCTGLMKIKLVKMHKI